MNEHKNSIPSAKLISHVLIDFSSEAEMELFINYVEKTGSNFYESMKKIGLMRFRLNQVWNKEGGFALSTLFEYKDENAYYKSGNFRKTLRPGMRDGKGHIKAQLIDMNRREYILGDKGRSGDQWDIWQAVYSPVGKDGYPKPIWLSLIHI